MKEDLAKLKKQLSQVQKHMLSMSFQGFTNLLKTTRRVEDAMILGLNKSKKSSKGKHSQDFLGQEVNTGQPSPFHWNPHPNTLSPNWHIPPQRPNCSKPPKRQFTTLNHPLGKVFAKMKEMNLLQPKEPKTPLNPPYPKGYYPNLHCVFHQGPRHHTDKCFSLIREKYWWGMPRSPM